MDSCAWCKVTALCLTGLACGVLFFWSLRVNYQVLLAQEHVRFRSGFPSQANWISSPYGTVNCYLFNVTNSGAFLEGEHAKMKLKEIGPIVYRTKGRNQVLSQTEKSLTYRKIRYHSLEFDAEASCAPDILNQTIVLPNFMLLGVAAKLHSWNSLLRVMFNGVTMTEPIFLTESIYYFLWNFTTPRLDLLSKYVPDIVANCGMLHNAMRNKEEIYDVKIGLEHGMDNFFRVNSLNHKTTFPQHFSRLKYLNKEKYPNVYCPIEVAKAFDNNIFPPLMTKLTPITIVAAESCRTFDLKYNRTVEHLGFSAYEYIITDEPTVNSCLDKSMGIQLHNRMFDVSKCAFNDVPSALSSPHFYGSSYNWQEHFEGLKPSAGLHEATIVVEPTTGIPIEEKYRFQYNTPMPDMTGYSKNLEKFSNMVVPAFWCEYDLDDLPWIPLFMMRLNIYGMPIIQPLFIILFILLTTFCFFKCFLIYKEVTFRAFFKRYILDKVPKKSLETTFESSSKEKEIEISKM